MYIYISKNEKTHRDMTYQMLLILPIIFLNALFLGMETAKKRYFNALIHLITVIFSIIIFNANV